MTKLLLPPCLRVCPALPVKVVSSPPRNRPLPTQRPRSAYLAAPRRVLPSSNDRWTTQRVAARTRARWTRLDANAAARRHSRPSAKLKRRSLKELACWLVGWSDVSRNVRHTVTHTSTPSSDRIALEKDFFHSRMRLEPQSRVEAVATEKAQTAASAIV